MLKTYFPIALLVLVKVLLALADKDYYWRDYDGTIPEDAVIGGRDNNNKNIYIGQAYIKDKGLVVVQIDQGKRSVYAEMDGIQLVDQNIKILCGPSYQFYWIPSNLSKLHTDVKEKVLVVGGHEDAAKRYFVGRINCADGFCIGKVLEQGYQDRSVFYGVDRSGHQLKTDSYEVLVNEAIINVRES